MILFYEESGVLKLILSFITETQFWNPALEIFSVINELGKLSDIIDEKEKKIHQYENGLTIKSYQFKSFDVSDSDGVLVIFDARKKEDIDPLWREYLLEIIEKLKENKVVLVGIRISKEADWSKLIEQFDINEGRKKCSISCLESSLVD